MLVVNIMTDSVMTASPGKNGIRLKREIWTWAGMRTRIAQVVERRARNPEVRGSNSGSGPNMYGFIFNLKNRQAKLELDPEIRIPIFPLHHQDKKHNSSNLISRWEQTAERASCLSCWQRAYFDWPKGWAFKCACRRSKYSSYTKSRLFTVSYRKWLKHYL